MRKWLSSVLSLTLTAGLFGAEYPKLGEDIYDPQADANVLISEALSVAKLDHKHVLLMFGANWCIWCHRLHATLEGNPEVAAALAEDFVLVMVDVNTRHGPKRNADVNERYGNPIQHGLPVLVVLDATGKQLTTQETGSLEESDGHSPAKVLAFLREWAPSR
ncbi:MAG: thioredoxin family protein [Opitutaceae bacterium]